MPRPTNTEERRAQIIDGLKAVMAERGYEQASVTAIAAAAGLSPGLVHYHFAHKEAILVALVDALEQTFIARDQARRDGRPWGDLYAFLDALLAIEPAADLAAVRCWVLIGAAAERIPAVGAAYREAVERQHAALTARIAAVLAAEGAGGDPAAMAAMLLAAVGGVFQLSSAAPRVVPPGTAAPLLRHMARGLLSATWP